MIFTFTVMPRSVGLRIIPNSLVTQAGWQDFEIGSRSWDRPVDVKCRLEPRQSYRWWWWSLQDMSEGPVSNQEGQGNKSRLVTLCDWECPCVPDVSNCETNWTFFSSFWPLKCSILIAPTGALVDDVPTLECWMPRRCHFDRSAVFGSRISSVERIASPGREGQTSD